MQLPKVVGPNRAISTVAAGMFMSAILAACSGGAAPASGGDSATGGASCGEITFGAPKDGNVSAQVALADSLGYFTDRGLNVSVRYFPNAGDLSTAIAADSVDIGAGGTTPVTTLRASGFPAVVLAQLADISGAQQVVVSDDIIDPEDLKGRQMGVALGTISELLAEAFLDEYGLTREDVTFVNLGPTDMITSLSRGDIAAAALWEPHATRAVAQGARRLVSGTTSFVDGEPVPQRLVGDHAVLFAAEGWVADNSECVESIVAALLEATVHIEEDSGDAMERVGEALGLEPAEAENTFAVNDYVMRIDDQLVEDMEAEAEFLVAKDKIDEMVTADEWVRTDSLAAVAPDLVTWGR